MRTNIIAGITLCLLISNAWAGARVPEPESLALLAAGAVAAGLVRWLRKRK